MTIVGISGSHNAAAAMLAPDGTLDALQEERPRRIKNYHEIPTRSIKWLLGRHGLKAADAEVLALAGHVPIPPLDRMGWITLFRNSDRWQRAVRNFLPQTPLRHAVRSDKRRRRRQAYEALGFRSEAIQTFEPHECHAATAYFGRGERQEPVPAPTDRRW